MFNKDEHPVLFCIAQSAEKLLIQHTKINHNFKNGFVFNNPAFTVGVRGPVLNEETWGEAFNVNLTGRYYGLKFNEIFDNGGTLKPEFVATFNIDLRGQLAKNLKKIFDAARTRYEKNPPMNEYYENLINCVKKGSKIFHNILSKNTMYWYRII
jgi:hypothetical protein